LSELVVRRAHANEGSQVRVARLAVLAEESWRDHFLRQEQAFDSGAWRARAVVTTNEPATALYGACGFVPSGEAKEAVTVSSLVLQRMERELRTLGATSV
jgi:hypothetical protein